jgi:hypothetical protein
MLAIAVLLTLFAGATWLSAVNPRAALLLIIFLVPWGGLVVDVGLRVVAWQLVLAPLCLTTLVRLSQPGWSPPRLVCGSLLGALALWAVCMSLLQLGFLPGVGSAGGVLRGPAARAIVQILFYLFGLSLAVLIPWLLNGIDDLKRAVRLYICSVVVLAIIGWLQLVIWYSTGSNPLPINVVSDALGGIAATYEGYFGFDAFTIYRMNSLAGEPRNLATALVLAMLIIQSIAMATPQVPGRKLAVIWVFMLISTLATFSTSAAVIWPVATATLLPVMWVLGIKVQRSRKSIIAGVLALVVPVTLGIVAAEAYGIPVLDLLAERTLERLTSDGAVEDFDLAITDYLRSDPAAAVTGVGLGNAHLYAMPFLDPLFALYAEGTVFTGKTTVVKMVSEIGAIGFGLFLLWYLSLVWQTRQVVRGHPEVAAAVPMAMMTIAVYLNTNQIAGEALLMAGGMALLVASLRQPEAPALPEAVPA